MAKPKIALIAMSGVRAHDPELTRLGMTLPGFVERSKVIASLPSLSLLTIAGLTPDSFHLAYYEIREIREADQLPECDLAAVGTFSAQAKDAYEIGRRYAARGIPLVLGGLHATAVPQEALRHFTAVAVGEGELVWPRILRDFERGALRGIYAAEGEFDLADAPMPRFDLLDPTRYNRITVQTQRGCPWRCEFCASSTMITTRYKLKPVEKVVEEIRAIKRIWPQPFIEFADDNTFVNKPHSMELVRAVGNEQVPWFTETDISIADDPDLLAAMRDSGCRQILIGLESPSANGLEGLELKRNWKRDRLASYSEAIARIQSHGIAVNGCFVLGLDGHTTDVFEDVAQFVTESGLHQVQITVLTPFPGTPLYRRLERAERIIEPGAWEKCTLFDVNFRPAGMSARELQGGLVHLAQRLYSREAKRARVRAFSRQASGADRLAEAV